MFTSNKSSTLITGTGPLLLAILFITDMSSFIIVISDRVGRSGVITALIVSAVSGDIVAGWRWRLGRLVIWRGCGVSRVVWHEHWTIE